jgi:hypothetical protein
LEVKEIWFGGKETEKRRLTGRRLRKIFEQTFPPETADM